MTQPVQADASTFDDVVVPSTTFVPLTRARSNLLLLLVALIWGSAFVARSVAARTLGTLTFTALASRSARSSCCPSPGAGGAN